MALFERGYRLQKFFPAEPAGGVDYLRRSRRPLPKIGFCPTGGIRAADNGELSRAAERDLRRRFVAEPANVMREKIGKRSRSWRIAASAAHVALTLTACDARRRVADHQLRTEALVLYGRRSVGISGVFQCGEQEQRGVSRNFFGGLFRRRQRRPRLFENGLSSKPAIDNRRARRCRRLSPRRARPRRSRRSNPKMAVGRSFSEKVGARRENRHRTNSRQE